MMKVQQVLGGLSFGSSKFLTREDVKTGERDVLQYRGTVTEGLIVPVSFEMFARTGINPALLRQNSLNLFFPNSIVDRMLMLYSFSAKALYDNDSYGRGVIVARRDISLMDATHEILHHIFATGLSDEQERSFRLAVGNSLRTALDGINSLKGRIQRRIYLQHARAVGFESIENLLAIDPLSDDYSLLSLEKLFYSEFFAYSGVRYLGLISPRFPFTVTGSLETFFNGLPLRATN